MSFVSRLVDPNPPLTADQVQAAAAAALAASPTSPVASIQRGDIGVTGVATSTVVTVVEVDLTKAMLNFLGTTGFSAVGGTGVRIQLTSATQITWKRINSSSDGRITYELIEYV